MLCVPSLRPLVDVARVEVVDEPEVDDALVLQAGVGAVDQRVAVAERVDHVRAEHAVPAQRDALVLRQFRVGRRRPRILRRIQLHIVLIVDAAEERVVLARAIVEARDVGAELVVDRRAEAEADDVAAVAAGRVRRRIAVELLGDEAARADLERIDARELGSVSGRRSRARRCDCSRSRAPSRRGTPRRPRTDRPARRRGSCSTAARARPSSHAFPSALRSCRRRTACRA